MLLQMDRSAEGINKQVATIALGNAELPETSGRRDQNVRRLRRLFFISLFCYQIGFMPRFVLIDYYDYYDYHDYYDYYYYLLLLRLPDRSFDTFYHS